MSDAYAVFHDDGRITIFADGVQAELSRDGISITPIPSDDAARMSPTSPPVHPNDPTALSSRRRGALLMRSSIRPPRIVD